MSPLVSAIVTSYNHERTVREAVKSALAQDLPDFEVVVIDDASTDGSVALLEPFRDEPRVRLELHVGNRGVSETFDHGLSLARGEYVAYLGSDDRWEPDHLSGALGLLAGSEAGFCYGRVAVVDGDDRDVTGELALFDSAGEENFFDAIVRRSNFVPFISVVMRRDLARESGGFDASLAALQDYDLWIRLAARAPVLFRDAVCGAFRWDGRNTSRRSFENSVRFREDLVIVLEKALAEQRARLDERGLTGVVHRRLADAYARLARRQDDSADRARSYRRSLDHQPGRPGVYLRWLASRLRAALGAA